ncbi:uncharacterized protein B0H18DRAFT_120691 [Fomitopsis serialis]|uniref:uncharacterized protein n=1 Tax=Fomitopsis serialis TaxID=139415 RepID=UPI0020073758|nr:uncharacterized protein B0H18DRAFT_120691 [Neoantrodia serialis]KAH9930986.1 hypothetical protein B0H18DRAFT_120691 [Neoantrodia serialis]
MSPPCPRFHSLVLLLSIVLQCILSVCGEIRTIDDTYGDSVTGATPVYPNEDCWNEGPGCSACVLQPDPSEAHNGTWHDTTSNICTTQYPPTHSVTFSFNGTALSVYCIIVSQGPATWFTNLSFTLDGEISNTQFSPSVVASTYGFQYNSRVFIISSLSNEQHTFTMSAMTGSSASVLLFDYAEYTYEDPTPATPSPTSTTSTSSSTSSTSSTSSSTSATSTDSPSPASTTSFSESRSSGSRSSQTTASSSSSATQSGTSEASVSTFGSTNPATTSVPSALGSHSASHTTIVAGAAAGGSVAIFLVIVVGVLIYIRRKKRAQFVPTTNILDDGDGDGDDSSAQPLDEGNTSPESTGQTGGWPPRRSRPLMTLANPCDSGSTVLSIPLMLNKKNELGSAECLSAKVDARSGYRHEHDVPALPSSSDGDTLLDTAVQSLDGGNVSSADRRDGAVWQVEMTVLRQEMAQEMARLREQTAVYATVPPPPPPYV